jgi:hypothetical protein
VRPGLDEPEEVSRLLASKVDHEGLRFGRALDADRRER